MENFSVIICAYTLSRWSEMLNAVKSVQDQTLSPSEIILVIDHNETMYIRARQQFKNVVVIENSGERGLSGARNTGIMIARSEFVAFMDEDAVAQPDWLERLALAYYDRDVLGVGGAIIPMWISGQPKWFPEEFNWVVGCTYVGMPIIASPVRNLIGCNMSFRRAIFEVIGGFRGGIGRVGAFPLGCEETELCIRARQYWTHGQFLYEPSARVLHQVPAQRKSLKYFLSRCAAEGLSKALVSSLVGQQDGLNSERLYVANTLPRAVQSGLRDAFLHHQASGLGKSVAIMIGLISTMGGYIAGKASQFLERGLEAKHPITLPTARAIQIEKDIDL